MKNIVYGEPYKALQPTVVNFKLRAQRTFLMLPTDARIKHVILKSLEKHISETIFTSILNIKVAYH